MLKYKLFLEDTWSVFKYNYFKMGQKWAKTNDSHLVRKPIIPVYVDPRIQTNHNSISFDSGDQCTYDKSSVPIIREYRKVM